MCAGMPQRAWRSAASGPACGASGSHCSGTTNRQFTGQEAVSVAGCALIPIWQLAIFPAVPVSWRATHDEEVPDFRYPVSSKIIAFGLSSLAFRWVSRARTCTGSHGGSDTNCCRACSSPSGRRAAIGWIDLRLPSTISSRR